MPSRNETSQYVASPEQRCSYQSLKFQMWRPGWPASHVSITYCWRSTRSNLLTIRSSSARERGPSGV